MSRNTAVNLLAIGLVGLASTTAQAQSAPDDKWQWEVGLYGWFPAMGGSTSFPSNGNSGPNVDVSTQDVIDSIKMIFMGQIEARKGLWGLWSDVVYADFGASKTGSRDFTVDHRPVSATADLGMDLKATAWSTAGLYQLTAGPQNTTDLLFGARLLDLNQTLTWTTSTNVAQLPGRSGSGAAALDNWDAIVGLKGRYFFGDSRKWFLPYYADVGTGESKLTWQVNAGLGYKFAWGSMFATYRYLDYQFKSGSTIQSLTFNGALVGVGFQF